MLTTTRRRRGDPAGRWLWRDDQLVVAWQPANDELVHGRLSGWDEITHTPHFTVGRCGGDTLVLHRLAAGEIDNDVGDLLNAELFAGGLLPHSAAWFERVFTGVVCSTAAEPDEAWLRFYANTLRRMAAARRRSVTVSAGSPGGAVAAFAAIYDHAASLVEGDSVLDTGTCFGFFPLLLAARRADLSVTGSDHCPGTVALARRVGAQLRSPARFAEADVTRPLPGGPVDTVSALHLLEHLGEDHTAAVLRHLCAAARCRVVIAVPLEAEPDRVYGHVRTFDLPGMAALGEATGWAVEVHEYLGGWLVLDRR